MQNQVQQFSETDFRQLNYFIDSQEINYFHYIK